MGGQYCCVRDCGRRSHDHRGREIPTGLTFYCFPAWRGQEGELVAQLTWRRRAAWVAAVGCSSITFDRIPACMRVCSRHFHSGKPAYEMLESDPDWVPSLQMGHDKGTRKRTERLLPSERDHDQRGAAETSPPDGSRSPHGGSAGGTDLWHSETTTGHLKPVDEEGRCKGAVRSAVLSWRQMKSQLQSVLQRQTDANKQPEDETREHPAAVERTDISFRDFFRDALEASLEGSIRSRSARQTSITGEFEVELNLKLPPVKEKSHPCEESSSSSSSSSCLNCVRLQRRIRELQEKLSALTGEPEDMEACPFQLDQDLSPETVHTEAAESEWMEPLSPSQVSLRDVADDEDWADTCTPGSSDPSKRRFRRPPCFRTPWLKMFWFLQYSPALDRMWCKVCRLHADGSHQHLAMVKGSNMFKLDNIKKHSRCNYHRYCVRRHKLQAGELKLKHL